MRRAKLDARKEFAANLAQRDRDQGRPTWNLQERHRNWNRPDPRLFYDYWLKRFTLEEISQLASALDHLADTWQDTPNTPLPYSPHPT